MEYTSLMPIIQTAYNIESKKHELIAYDQNLDEWKKSGPFINIFTLALEFDPHSSTNWMVEALQKLPIWNNIL